MGVYVTILIVLVPILLYLCSSIKEKEEKRERELRREGNEIRRSIEENADERRATALRNDIRAYEYHRIKEIIADKIIAGEDMKELAHLVYHDGAAEDTLEAVKSSDTRKECRHVMMALTEDAKFVEEKWPDL
jgi:hypothetical protein